MSENVFASLDAAMAVAKGIRNRDQWLSGDVRQMLDAIPAVVFVAEDAACSSIYGNAAAEALLRAPRNANVSKSAIDAPTPQTFDVFDTDGVLIPIDQLPIQRAARGEIVADAQWEVRFADGEGIFMRGPQARYAMKAARFGARSGSIPISVREKTGAALHSEIAAGPPARRLTSQRRTLSRIGQSARRHALGRGRQRWFNQP